MPSLSREEAPAVLAEIQQTIADRHGHLDRYFSNPDAAPSDRVLAGVWFKALERLCAPDISYSRTDDALYALQVAQHVAEKRGECIQDLLPFLLRKIYQSPAYREAGIDIAPHLLNVAQTVLAHPTAIEETKAHVLRLKREIEKDLRC